MLGVQDYVDLGQELNAEIRDMEKAISNLVKREQNLIRMMSFDGVDSSLIESDLAPINAERRALENRLQQQRSILSNRRKFARSMSKIRQFSHKIKENLEGLDVDGKIRTLAVFNVKVVATKGQFSIQLSVDPKM